MQHARSDYDRIQDPAGKIPDGEPVFLLRGQDVTAPGTLDYWADQNAGSSPVLAQAVRDHAERMRDWQAAHGAKAADAPEDTLRLKE